MIMGSDPDLLKGIDPVKIQKSSIARRNLDSLAKSAINHDLIPLVLLMRYNTYRKRHIRLYP